MDTTDEQIDLRSYGAFLFDLDGVVTPTVDLHKRAWAQTFDEAFARHGASPYEESDYFTSLDGRPRFEGVETLLRARDLDLPHGEPGADDLDTVIGIGNRKNRVFAELLERDGIDPYPGTVKLLDALAGLPVAIVSSSRNAESVLAASGLRDRFGIVVDGVVAAEQGLPGKPEPDTFVYAAGLLGCEPEQAVVFEDAESGVLAAKRGGMGLVVGVDRGAGRVPLLTSGADVVVSDLEELLS